MEKKDRGIIVVLVCTMMLVMAAVYAAFTSTLTINGTVEISTEWSVRISSISCTTTQVIGGVVPTEATGTIDSNKVATISMDFKQPGDSASCVITVKNNGTLDARLTGISALPSGEAPITFTVIPTTEQLAGRATLVKNGGEETITVQGTYDSSVTTQPTVTNKTLQVVLTYEQA